MRKPAILILSIALEFLCFATARSQERTFDLQQLLKEKKLVTHGQNVIPLTDGGKKAISQTGIIWLKDVNFSEGTIEVDLRGKDVLQKSFIGIVFHGVDTVTHDVIYFRPFNFLSTDPVRKIHAVQFSRCFVQLRAVGSAGRPGHYQGRQAGRPVLNVRFELGGGWGWLARSGILRVSQNDKGHGVVGGCHWSWPVR